MASLAAHASMQTRVHFKHVGPSSTQTDDKKLRKKLQNRANQRARRLRLQAGNVGRNPQGKLPFQVRRWRLGSDEPQASHAEPELDRNRMQRQYARGIPIQTKEINPNSESDSDSESGSMLIPENPGHLPPAVMQSYISRLPRSAGQLLSLIHYNVFRGLHYNKVVLGRTVLSCEPSREPLRFDRAFPKVGTVVPFSPDVPKMLCPTKAQRDRIHSSWINIFPFPAMRENLIRWETSFDHPEFCRDVLGPLFDTRYCLLWKGSVPVIRPATMGRVITADEDDVDDGLTAGRQGFIVWGEPHDLNSWEVTPGFLKKWAWTMQGCDELISSTNHWRGIRGEAPLRFSLEVCAGSEPY